MRFWYLFQMRPAKAQTSHHSLVIAFAANIHMGLIATKPVFEVSDKARLKPVFSATETSWKTEISVVASLDIILSNKRITKALTRLRGWAGWSAPLLFANHRRQVSSRRGPYSIGINESASTTLATSPTR